ncbi:protoglobin domain-containing protein [Halorussus halophilus]|uniref:protoglobin domain-containing protein n=1 Tax=Halorussus halophilus TaxID=2650975 RepID=UPI001300E226|nr:protoglobin domain-containing protein [Halorussus halophilus]
MSDTEISGYTYGEDSVAESPLSMAEFEKLKQTVMWSEEDEEHLRMAGDVLDGQIDDVLELWYGFVGDHDFLLEYFSTPEGEPIDEYLDRVRARFGQWIRDTCDPPYDEDWLNYQQEIALRHHRTKKNQTDDAESVPIIHFRYMTAFVYPITATIRQFLENSDHDAETVEKMYDAWFKSVVLQVTLWSYPYVKDGDF